MSTLTIVLIVIAAALICFVIGLCVGFAGNVPVQPMSSTPNPVKIFNKDAPMVFECQLDQPLTVDQMAMDVVGPNLIKIWRHFGKPLYNVPSSSKVAEEMLQWYNPDSEYTKLVIVGYIRGGVVKIAWTWVKKDPKKYIMTPEAVEGLEKYYTDELGNTPVAIYNPEG